MRVRRDLAVLCLVSVLASGLGCRERAREPSPPARAFYFWRTRLDLSPAERDALTSLRVTRLFVRFFDVEWSAAEAAPRRVAVLDARSPATLPAGLDVVPVVFLRAEVFARSRPGELPALASRTWQEIRRVAADGGLPFRELQVDCDWTDTTQAAYFAFLEHLGREAHAAGVALGATIRLHQVKYRERTGVPPVERGMLMFYNMGRISADRDRISIFDPASAALYTARLRDYPLPLDAALPLWSWTVHLRGEEVVGLLQATDPDELPAIPWLAPAGAGRFAARRTAFLHGSLVREGDVLKAEPIGDAETRAAAEMVAAALPLPPGPGSGARPRTVALFDLSERNLSHHGPTDLDRLFPLFQ
jgi:hypothetical protein